MKIAANALIWSTEFTERDFDLLPRLREKGFDGFEIPIFDPAKIRAKAIREALRNNDLECTICAILPQGLNPISDDSAVRSKTRQHLVDCIAVAAELGSKLLGGPVYAPIGYLPGRRRSVDEWQRAIDLFSGLGEVLSSHDVTLALEPLNRFETFFLNTAGDAVSLCQKINHSRIGLLLDTFHMNIEEKDVASAFRSTGVFLKHVHACENDRGIPGTGHVDFPGIARYLQKINYSGWITIESFGYTHKELAAAAAIWRDLAPSPESIAFEGLTYIRGITDRSSARV